MDRRVLHSEESDGQGGAAEYDDDGEEVEGEDDEEEVYEDEEEEEAYEDEEEEDEIDGFDEGKERNAERGGGGGGVEVKVKEVEGGRWRKGRCESSGESCGGGEDEDEEGERRMNHLQYPLLVLFTCMMIGLETMLVVDTVAGKSLNTMQMSPGSSLVNAMQSSQSRTQGRGVAISGQMSYQSAPVQNQVNRASSATQPHSVQRSPVQNRAQPSVLAPGQQFGQRTGSGSQASSPPKTALSINSYESGETETTSESSKSKGALVGKGKESIQGSGRGSFCMAVHSYGSIREYGCWSWGNMEFYNIGKLELSFIASALVMQFGGQPGGIGVPAVGMAFPGYVAQPQLGLGNSEMTWLPVLAGAAGALGATYCSPYIGVDGAYHARPSGQTSSVGSSSKESDNINKSNNEWKPSQRPELVNDEFGQRQKPRRQVEFYMLLPRGLAPFIFAVDLAPCVLQRLFWSALGCNMLQDILGFLWFGFLVKLERNNIIDGHSSHMLNPMDQSMSFAIGMLQKAIGLVNSGAIRSHLNSLLKYLITTLVQTFKGVRCVNCPQMEGSPVVQQRHVFTSSRDSFSGEHGGPTIFPENDNLGRTWVSDQGFLVNLNVAANISDISAVKYVLGGATPDTAPSVVYGTATILKSIDSGNVNVNLTWEFIVDPGFQYLVRFHFCDIFTKDVHRLYFDVYIDSWLLAKEHNSCFLLLYNLGSAVYMDFVTALAVSNKLRVSVGPSSIPTVQHNVILNGLEIMKMKYFPGSLGGKGKKSARQSHSKTKCKNSHTVGSKNSNMGYRIPFAAVEEATNCFDESWVIGIGGFGKVYKGVLNDGPEIDQSHVSTAVKGTFGYLDPEYFERRQLTEKSDVYSFGMVLFEVLCARPVTDPTFPEGMNLADWVMEWKKKGQLEQVIDPALVRKIRPVSLGKFCETAEKCFSECRIDRPSMGDVLRNLEYALQLQEVVVPGDPEENSTNMIGELSPPINNFRHVDNGVSFAEFEASSVDDLSEVSISKGF
ncbi:hypothetical protein GH714_022883 [Hevea brasiliensis]|uniref:Malectin-like domain-containing protein n=1 Tax=Hevea brasiliensis TaxID=3981 RepID=A0A6A6LMN3_HEVBR|nr:hypothetical protein GH714_022883 [Hevea brasiliensis]